MNTHIHEEIPAPEYIHYTVIHAWFTILTIYWVVWTLL